MLNLSYPQTAVTVMKTRLTGRVIRVVGLGTHGTIKFHVMAIPSGREPLYDVALTDEAKVAPVRGTHEVFVRRALRNGGPFMLDLGPGVYFRGPLSRARTLVDDLTSDRPDMAPSWVHAILTCVASEISCPVLDIQ